MKLIIINIIIILLISLVSVEFFLERPLTGWVYDVVVKKLPDDKDKFVKVEELD